MLIKKSLLFIILAFCFPIFIQADTLSLDEFANQAMLKIKNADFDSLFNDFVLPKDYTAQNTQSDKEAITMAFKELTHNKIGSLEDFTKVDSTSEQIIPLDLATGSQQTTGSLPSTNLFYKTTFSKFGNAYMLVGIYKEGDKLFIKNITIGLPQSNPHSMQIAQDFVKFMTNFAEEQQKKDSSTPKQIVIN